MAFTSRLASSSSGGIGRILKLLAILIGLLMPLIYLLEQKLDSFYVFETDHLHDLAKRSIQVHGNDTRVMAKYIVDELASRPSTKAFINHDQEWFFNNAGGAMGSMYIIHASFTEYLIIFGTAIGTEGHTGRHTADDYFHILQGVQLAHTAGEFEAEVYSAGSVHHLRRGTVKQYKMPERCFALEYARGWIPPMMFFGYADGFFSTLDVPTLWRTTYVTGKQIFGNLLLGKF